MYPGTAGIRVLADGDARQALREFLALNGNLQSVMAQLRAAGGRWRVCRAPVCFRRSTFPPQSRIARMLQPSMMARLQLAGKWISGAAIWRLAGRAAADARAPQRICAARQALAADVRGPGMIAAPRR